MDLKLDLYSLVSKELLDVAWHGGYPLSPGIGIWAFLEAFRESKIPIDRSKDSATFFITREICGKTYEFTSTLSFEEILRGWGHGPKGSPNRLYDSIHAVYDRMIDNKFPREDYSSFREEKNESHKLRLKEPSKICDKMESHLLGFFEKYQEQVFVPLSGEVPELQKPRLIHEIFEKFPLDVMEQAIILSAVDSTRPRYGPCEDYLVDNPDIEFNEDYFPSESTMVGLFLGQYFHKLSKLKGYSSWYGENSLREFTVRGAAGFKYASLLNWPEELANKKIVLL